MRYDADTRNRLLAELRARGLPAGLILLLQQVPRDSSVLDLGCATGYLAARLVQQGCRVDGVELDPEMAEEARQACRRVHQSDLDDPRAWDELEGPYQVILAADILEHLTDPWQALERIRKLLVPEGLLLASLPNAAAWPMRLHLLAGRFEYEASGPRDRTHLRFFTIHGFRQAAEQAGFQVLQILPTEARLPGLGRRGARLSLPMARRFPNLLAEHALWRLQPATRGET